MITVLEDAALGRLEGIGMGWLESMAESFVTNIIDKRLTIPAEDMPKVAESTAQWTTDGVALTVDQMQAADRATIHYCLDRAVSLVKAKL